MKYSYLFASITTFVCSFSLLILSFVRTETPPELMMDTTFRVLFVLFILYSFFTGYTFVKSIGGKNEDQI